MFSMYYYSTGTLSRETWHIKYIGCFDLHSSLQARILGASEAVWAAILAQIPLHTCTFICLLTAIRIQILKRKFRMGEFNDNLFHCSAHWNTQKTCRENSVDVILHCRPSYAHAAQRYLVSAILFPSERSGRKAQGLSLGCCVPTILSI